MIIQCKTCKTKYRFDESVMTEEGVWVRCSRCQNVFFQRSPLGADVRQPDILKEPDAPSELLPPKTPPEEAELFPEKLEEEDFVPEPKKKSPLLIWILGVILVILIACGGSLYLYPDAGDLILKKIYNVYPGLQGLLFGERAVPKVGPAQVKIVDLKQRFVENSMMGNIRIVEGMALNASSEPMARIKVKAELYDIIGARVRESFSYCGNLLSDQELKTATEEQIAKKLSTPQGSDISNDRITPNGMVPFMIIFLREPPGVTKTLVLATEAERLLP